MTRSETGVTPLLRRPSFGTVRSPGCSPVRALVFREVLELDRATVAIVGCGSPSRFLDLTPTAGWRAVRVRECGVVTTAVELEEAVRISLRDLVHGSVACFDRLIEALGMFLIATLLLAD